MYEYFNKYKFATKIKKRFKIDNKKYAKRSHYNKKSSAGHSGFISWTYGSSLAIIIGDMSVRIWDMETSENFLLPIEQAQDQVQTRRGGGGGTEIFTCLAYCADNQTICAGTNHGNLFTWRKTNFYAGGGDEGEVEDEDGRDVIGDNGGRNPHWQLNNVSNVAGAIKQCSWGLGEIGTPCILLNCISNVFIMREQPLIVFHSQEVAALQKTATRIWVERCSSQRQCLLQSEIPVANLAANDSYLVVSNGRRLIVHKLVDETDGGKGGDGDGKTLKLKAVNQFAAENLRIFLHEEKVITDKNSLIPKTRKI